MKNRDKTENKNLDENSEVEKAKGDESSKTINPKRIHRYNQSTQDSFRQVLSKEPVIETTKNYSTAGSDISVSTTQSVYKYRSNYSEKYQYAILTPTDNEELFQVDFKMSVDGETISVKPAHYMLKVLAFRYEDRVLAESAFVSQVKHLSGKKIQFIDEDFQYYLMKQIAGVRLSEKEFKSHNPKDNFSFAVALSQCIELLRSVHKQVHSYNIIHRDLNNENILYDKDKDTFTIIDYGFAMQEGDENSVHTNPENGAVCHPPEFMNDGLANRETDFYTIASVMLEDIWHMRDLKVDGDTNHHLTEFFENFNDIPPLERRKLAKLYSRMLSNYPQERPSYQELCEAFEDLLLAIKLQSVNQNNEAFNEINKLARQYREKLDVLEIKNAPFIIVLNTLDSLNTELIKQKYGINEQVIFAEFIDRLKWNYFPSCNNSKEFQDQLSYLKKLHQWHTLQIETLHLFIKDSRNNLNSSENLNKIISSLEIELNKLNGKYRGGINDFLLSTQKINNKIKKLKELYPELCKNIFTYDREYLTPDTFAPTKNLKRKLKESTVSDCYKECNLFNKKIKYGERLQEDMKRLRPDEVEAINRLARDLK